MIYECCGVITGEKGVQVVDLGCSFRICRSSRDRVGSLCALSRNLWFRTVSRAGLEDEFQRAVIRCERDHDFKCREHGCLQGYAPAYVMDSEKLLAVARKAMVWQRKNRGSNIGAEDQWVWVNERWEGTVTAIVGTQPLPTILGYIVQLLERVLQEGERQIVLVNEATEDEIFPCVRELPLNPKKRDRAARVDGRLLDYDYAKGHVNERLRPEGNHP